MTAVLIKQGEETQTHTGKKPCNDGGRDWRDDPPAQDHQGMLAASRSWGPAKKEDSNPRFFGDSPASPTTHNSIQTFGPRTMREYISLVLSHPVCGPFLGHPRKLPRGMITPSLHQQRARVHIHQKSGQSSFRLCVLL